MFDNRTSPKANRDMSDEHAKKRRDETRKTRVELMGAVIIGIAAILTAIATYQGSQVDGTVANKNTEAIALSTASNDAYNDYNTQYLVERDWILTYYSAWWNGEEAASILYAAMPDEVGALAEEWWTANEAGFADPDNVFIDDPFSQDSAAYSELESTYHFALGNARQEAANCAFFAAQVAGVQGDGYGLASVILAIALVVGGIAALLKGKLAQIIVIVVAAASLLLGAGVLAYAGDENEARRTQAEGFFYDNDDGVTRLSTDRAVQVADDRCPKPTPEANAETS